MKRMILMVIMMLVSFTAFAATPETSKPMINKEIVRKLAYIDIEGTPYEDVVITLKSVSDSFCLDNRVKVKVSNLTGKIIWKKTIKNAYLYVFSSGQVQVGQPKFDQIVIRKSPSSDTYTGKIREYEGIF